MVIEIYIQDSEILLEFKIKIAFEIPNKIPEKEYKIQILMDPSCESDCPVFYKILLMIHNVTRSTVHTERTCCLYVH